MMDYFEYTLVNVGLPEIDWNVTQIMWLESERNTLNVSQIE